MFLNRLEVQLFDAKIMLSIFGAISGVVAAFAISILLPGRKTSIFLSYPGELKELAMKLESELEDNNYDVIIGDEIINPGDNIKNKVTEAIEETDTFIVLLNENSRKSNYINLEINEALKNEKRIIPLLTSDNKKYLPKSINGLRFEILNANEQQSIEDVVEKIKLVS